MALNGIKVISFDADDTLFDFQGVMRLALGEVLAELNRQFPNIAGSLSIDTLIQHRTEAVLTLGGPDAKMETIRLEAFKRTLAHIEVVNDRLAAELTALFFEYRFSKIVIYGDVVPALQELRKHYMLGVLSNGNSYPERCGLDGWFSFGVYAHDHGFEKPDRRLFEEMIRRVGCPPASILHVGDSLRNDVIGAQESGICSVWLNRSEAKNESTIRPEYEIARLTELFGIHSA